jgi:hypothetical protein
MIVGFTGTRDPITEEQREWLHFTLDNLQVDEAHHGACVGADLEFHSACVRRHFVIKVHPPIKTKFLAVECLTKRPGVTVLPAKEYFPRNRDIAGVCDGLIALPKHLTRPLSEMHWGGTWYTVDYAQRLFKPVIICYPDQRIEKLEGR